MSLDRKTQRRKTQKPTAAAWVTKTRRHKCQLSIRIAFGSPSIFHPSYGEGGGWRRWGDTYHATLWGLCIFFLSESRIVAKKKKGDSNKTECEREREPSKHRHHTPTFLAITSKWNFKILTKNDNRQLFAPSDRHTQFLIYMTINNKNRKKTMRIRAARRRQHKSKRKCSDVIVWRQCRTLRL